MTSCFCFFSVHFHLLLLLLSIKTVFILDYIFCLLKKYYALCTKLSLKWFDLVEILKASFFNCFYLTFDTLYRHFCFCLAYLCLSAGGVWSETKNKKIKFFTSEQNALSSIIRAVPSDYSYQSTFLIIV